MKTKALRIAMFLVCLSAFSIACGDSDPDKDKGGEAGSGGSVGTGGSGGQDPGAGGSGGSGGSDEPGPLCGNGKLDPGEECDDGNIYDNDGCSSECKIEGTCEATYNFRSMSEVDAELGIRLLYWLPTAIAVTDDVNSCGAGARSAIFRYRNDDRRGILEVLALVDPPSAKAGVTIAVRRSCDEPDTEVACGFAGDVENLSIVRPGVVLEPNEEVYLVVDVIAQAVENPEMLRFGIGTMVTPAMGEGDACDVVPQPNAPVCDGDLACGEAGVCEANELPVVTDAIVHRDEEANRLVVVAEGTDTPGNVDGLRVVFLDEEGAPLSFQGEPETYVEMANLMGKTSFRAEWIVEDFNLPQARSVRLSFIDRMYHPKGFPEPGHSVSWDFGEESQFTIGEIPLLPPGEPCDPKGVLNKCVEGAVCRNSPGQGIVCTQN